MRPFEAAMVQAGTALGQLYYQYPRETVGVLTTTAWAAVSGYFLYAALQPEVRRRTRGAPRAK
jgi:hypothetical protein